MAACRLYSGVMKQRDDHFVLSEGREPLVPLGSGHSGSLRWRRDSWTLQQAASSDECLLPRPHPGRAQPEACVTGGRTGIRHHSHVHTFFRRVMGWADVCAFLVRCVWCTGRRWSRGAGLWWSRSSWILSAVKLAASWSTTVNGSSCPQSSKTRAAQTTPVNTPEQHQCNNNVYSISLGFM